MQAPRDLDPLLLVKLVRSLDAEVVHTHLVHADVYGGVAAKLRRAKLVSTKHNDDPFRAGPFRYVERGLAHAADRVVTISDSLRRFTVERVGVPASKVADDPLRPRRAAGAVGREPAGHRAGGRAGAALRCRGSRRRRASTPPCRRSRSFRTTWCSSCSARARSGPRSSSSREEQAVSSRVFLPGRVPDVAAWLRRAAVYVHPARWEGFGLAVLEAMVCGLPVVATNVSSLPELVVDGETGILVPPDDPAKLAAAVERALAEPALGEAGRMRARTEFSVAAMADRTAALYRSLSSASV